jgi:hypothetical protein
MRLSGLRWVMPAAPAAPARRLFMAEVAAPAADLGAEAAQALVPTHDPALSPHDEAIFLFHIAAEIEHALMVQYLYAAYSLNPDAATLSQDQKRQVQNWKHTILGIAKEEMAHFVSVQNILISLGGPLNFSREEYPFQSDFYPFPFTLQPLTIARRTQISTALTAGADVMTTLFSAALNRYIAAEMPALEAVPPNDRELVMALTKNIQVNRVGRLFERILALIDAGQKGGLVDADFDGKRVDAQARPQEWGGTGVGAGQFAPLVRPVKTRAEARKLLLEIAEQGEGHELGPTPSHFQRFLAIFRELETFDPAQNYLHSVPTNPSTTPLEQTPRGTPITNARSRRWAQLLNLRYRLLLGFLWHFLSTSGPLFGQGGDRTGRGWLVIATFHEMSHVQAISQLLVRLDLDDGGNGRKAAPCFELPYALALAERESDRWRHHLDVLAAAGRLRLQLGSPAATGPTAESEQDVLKALADRDAAMQTMLTALRDDGLLPRSEGFARVREILDEGLRGFPLEHLAHKEFWQVDEAAFIAAQPLPGLPAIQPGSAANSNLVKALRTTSFGRVMPAGRAPIDPTRIAYIEQWIDALGPGPQAGPGPGQTQNGSAPMGRYQKIIDVLDKAVGGSTSPIGAHGPFWRGKTKAQFLATMVFGQKLLIPGNGKDSNLVKALRGEAPFGSDIGTPDAIFRRMPAGRKAVPAKQVDVIQKWIDDGCPD